MRRTFGRSALAIMGALIVGLAATGTAAAAPAEQASCKAGAFFQRDMAGVYVSTENQIRVEVYSCGGSYIRWANQFGTHEAVYYSSARLPGGGIAAHRMRESVEALDAAGTVGYKPAEPGFIQIFTMTEYGELRGVYRLQKIGPEPIY